jgi:hypothetical protein
MIDSNAALKELIADGHHNGLCEQCNLPIPIGDVHEGDLGWYCSDKCLCDAENYDGMSDEQLRAWERRQMGIGG